MKKLKLFGSYLKYLVLTIVKIIRSKWFWIALAWIIPMYLTAWFNSNYEIKTKFTFGVYKRSEVQKVASISAEIVQPQVLALKPVLTEKEIVMQHEYGQDLYKLFFLESTLGKNDGCRKEGKYGGFGVMSQGKVMCYDTFEKAVDRAEYWWKQALEGNTKDEALCIWNTGKKQPQCNYSMTFNSL